MHHLYTAERAAADSASRRGPHVVRLAAKPAALRQQVRYGTNETQRTHHPPSGTSARKTDIKDLIPRLLRTHEGGVLHGFGSALVGGAGGYVYTGLFTPDTGKHGGLLCGVSLCRGGSV